MDHWKYLILLGCCALFFGGIRLLVNPDRYCSFNYPRDQAGIVLTGQPVVDISVKSSYWSYTKAFDSKCDYYIECDSQGLKNVTLSYCYLTETNYSGWCDAS
jgi:hypothetical protein